MEPETHMNIRQHDRPAPCPHLALLLRGIEVAKELGISRALAYRWMQNGTLPVVRVPGSKAVRVPRDALPADDRRVEMACNARKSVTFEIIERKAGEGPDAAGDETAVADAAAGAPSDEAAGAQADNQQIVAQPTVPSNPPNNIVISPDRLPGT